MPRYRGRHRPQSRLSSGKLLVPAAAAVTVTGVTAGAHLAQSAPAQSALTVNDSSKVTQAQPRANAAVAQPVNRVVAPAAERASRTAPRAAVSALRAGPDVDNDVRRDALKALAASPEATDHKVAEEPAPKAASASKSGASKASSSKASSSRTVSSTAGSSTAGSSSQAASSEGAEDRTGGAMHRPILAGHMTSGFGMRWGRMHEGIDYGAPIGTPLYAVASGTVTAVGSEGGLGQRVRIQLDGGPEVVYGHMSGFSSAPGQHVSAGEVIGYSGNSGRSTGPHLHFEVRYGGAAINPAGWLAARGLL